MARRHNTVAPATNDTSVLNGLISYCPGGCGYLESHCGCPESPRVMNGKTITDLALPVVSGCPGCAPDGCVGCGYKPHNCTCAGGPREALA